jgi:signal transduction histidine kinase
VAAALSGGLYVLAALHLRWVVVHGEADFPVGIWYPQFLALMVSCAALAVGASVLTAGPARRIVVFGQSLLVLLAAMPNGSNLWPETWAVFGALIQASVLLSTLMGTVLSIALIAAATMLQRPMQVWDVVIPAPDGEQLVLTAAFSVMLLSVSIVMRRSRERIEDLQQRLEFLNQTTSHLADANVRFQRYAADVETSSAAAERRRITRELHDSVGYALTNFMMIMQAAKDLVLQDPERLQHLISRAHEQARETLADVRSTLRQLRKEIGADNRGIHRIQDLARSFEEATGVDVDVSFANLPVSLGPELDEILFRVVQEGLTNSFHHGHATHVEVVFFMEDNGVRVSVRDNGHGAESITEGIGFRGLRERIQPKGGTLSLRGFTAGFQLSAWVPFDTESAS